MPTDTPLNMDSASTLSRTDIETRLREVIAWARAETAERRDDPIAARASAIVATKAEEALYRLLYPVP